MNGIWSEFAEEGLEDPEVSHDKFDFWVVDHYVKKYNDNGLSETQLIEKVGMRNFNLYVMNAL